jgi:hypothetical protein
MVFALYSIMVIIFSYSLGKKKFWSEIHMLDSARTPVSWAYQQGKTDIKITMPCKLTKIPPTAVSGSAFVFWYFWNTFHSLSHLQIAPGHWCPGAIWRQPPKSNTKSIFYTKKVWTLWVSTFPLQRLPVRDGTVSVNQRWNESKISGTRTGPLGTGTGFSHHTYLAYSLGADLFTWCPTLLF